MDPVRDLGAGQQDVDGSARLRKQVQVHLHYASSCHGDQVFSVKQVKKSQTDGECSSSPSAVSRLSVAPLLPLLAAWRTVHTATAGRFQMKSVSVSIITF